MSHAPKTNNPLRPIFHVESLDVTQLPAQASSSLPVDFQLHKLAPGGSAELILVWDGSDFLDESFQPVTTPVTGVIRFLNPSSTDISFAW